MFQNSNKDVVRHLSHASLNSNKMRNRFVGIAIILATMLLTVTSVFGYNSFMELAESTGNDDSVGTILTIVLIGIIVLLACSLVIYNIFYISIVGKIKEYGQLRTIGMTRIQVRKMVVFEGRSLSLRYIPLGMLIGCIIAYVIRPSAWLMVPDIVIAFTAGLFTFWTVMISVRKPSKIASNTSPIEAIKLSGTEKDNKKAKKSTKKLTPFYLGMMHLSRSRKKAVITFISLMLSGILFVSFATVLGSLDPEARAEFSFPYGGNFHMEISSELVTVDTSMSALQVDNPLSDDLKQEIRSLPGVKNVITEKFIEGKVLNEGINENIDITNICNENIESLNKYLKEGNLPSATSDDLKNIVINNTKAQKFYNQKYAVGDTIKMELFDGNNKTQHEFTVTAIINNPDTASVFYLPDRLMDLLMTENVNRSFEIVVDKNHSKQVELALQTLVDGNEKLTLKTFAETVAGWKNMFHFITVIVYVFIAIIFCFSAISLTNTIITNIISRKEELGIMQAIGLERKQLMKMMNVEIGFLTAGSFLVSIILGNMVGYLLASEVGKMSGLTYVIYQFPFLAVALYLLFMMVIQIALMKFLSVSFSKQTVIERMKVAN